MPLVEAQTVATFYQGKKGKMQELLSFNYNDPPVPACKENAITAKEATCSIIFFDDLP